MFCVLWGDQKRRCDDLLLTVDFRPLGIRYRGRLGEAGGFRREGIFRGTIRKARTPFPIDPILAVDCGAFRGGNVGSLSSPGDRSWRTDGAIPLLRRGGCQTRARGRCRWPLESSIPLGGHRPRFLSDFGIFPSVAHWISSAFTYSSAGAILK
jgi:hypothetical protein